MPYRPFADQNCSVARALEIVGERWTLLIMREVLFGRGRFADIRRSVGVAPNILSDRLTLLVEQGLVKRRLYSEHPEAYEYVATRKGADLSPVITALMQWGDRYAAPAAPPRVAVHTKCDHDADPRMHCSHCGEPIGRGELKVRPGKGATAHQRAEGVLPK